MKLLQSINNKITKDKNGENVTDSEITEVALVQVAWVSAPVQPKNVGKKVAF